MEATDVGKAEAVVAGPGAKLKRCVGGIFANGPNLWANKTAAFTLQALPKFICRIAHKAVKLAAD